MTLLLFDGTFCIIQVMKGIVHMKRLKSLFLLASVLIAYIPFAFNTDYYVDSEVIINIPGTTYNWLEIGRYGLVIVKKLLNTDWYNPYYTGVLMLLFLWLTGLVLMHLFKKLFPLLPEWMCVFGSLVFLTYPTFTEQYYFHFQSAEIAFGLLLSIVGMVLLYKFLCENNRACFILSIPIYVLVFAIYQSFIPLALCGYLMIFLSAIVQKDCDNPFFLRSILGSILHFAFSFLISQGINRIFFASGNGYLSEQVIWAENSIKDSIVAIIKACFSMFIGYGVFYTSILCIALVFAIITLFILLRKKGMRPFIWSILATLGITIIPFFLTMLLGTVTSVRTQFVYPLSAVALIFTATTIWLLYGKPASCDKAHNFANIIGIVFMCIVALSQVVTVRYIWHVHTEITDFDKETSMELLDTLYDSYIMNDNGSTILWGHLQPETKYDNMIRRSPSYLFRSVYNLEHDTEPYCFYSTIRVLGYLESMGHTFTLPNHSTHRISAYFMNRDNLAVFPQEGSFAQGEGTLTINLGNCPEYYY